MFIIHGAYHFWPKRVAFRNDYCLSCRGVRRSVRTRTFDVGHVFWIPVLPVGFWKRWACSACGRDPHANPKTRRSYKWAGLICLIFVSVIFWATPAPPDFVVGGWVIRVSFPLAAILLLRHLLRTPRDLSLKEQLATVPPASEAICPFCTTPLVGGDRWSCPGCGVIRC
jgi:hypothetical protein